MTSQDKESPTNIGSVRQSLRIDPSSQRIDKVFFRRLWAFCVPYWSRQGAWLSYMLFAVVIVIDLMSTGVGAATTILSQNVQNALVAKNVSDYWQFWFYLTGLGLALFATGLVSQYASARLNMDWRRWMTAHLIDEYLGSRTYYAITLDGDIDNPDQRIQQEIAPIILMVSQLPTSLLHSTLNIGVQVAILAGISVPMLIATFCYCVVNGFVTYFINKPLIKMNWDATVADADMRSGLLHVRDHAETIAFYRGENGERVHLTRRLALAISTDWNIAIYNLKTSVLTRMIGLVWGVMPMVLVAPLFFSGKIEFGAIAAAGMAATMINASLATFINFIPTISRAVPHVVRVAEIREKFAKLGAYKRAQHVGHFRREVSEENIGFERSTLMTPGGERTLFSNVTALIPKGSRLLIVGPTGTGKSSALRAIAGLWDLGHGIVRSPPEEQTVYLPQRPYTVPGSLRHQLLYPGNAEVAPTDDAMIAALRASCIESLAERYPDLSAEADWGRMLSLGEQQRLGFARAILTGAHFVFLDEATSAVDVDTERRLYAELISRSRTIVSVGHRPTLLGYHDLVLELRPDGTGEVMSVERYLAKEEAAQVRASAETRHDRSNMKERKC